MSLLAELKRRRVFRVAGAYLVGAWLVLQVGDVVFPALRLPPWTLTLLVVLVVLGFPVALLLGWAFDITPGGIERTPGAPFRLSFPIRAAALATLIVSSGILGFVALQRRAVAAKLDANAVAIVPFRVLGDASLMVMREGMVDLLSAKMTGAGGARAIDSRTTLALWRRTIEDEKQDLAPIEAMQLARRLGAGNVLLGEIVGTAGNVAVTAKLYSAVSGAVIESVEETAAPSDVLQLVDRMVTKLLSRQAGEAHRVEALLSESLPAVRAYLDGMRFYRNGEQDSAAARLNAALEDDSTFALAGLYLALAKSWSGYGPDYQRGRRLAWQYRERLPQRDRDHLEAWLGANFPNAPQSASEQIRAFEHLTQRYPDMVDAWYQLGDRYYHIGAAADVENPIPKALQAWSRALAFDSTYAPAFEHLPIIHAENGDTTQLRRAANVIFGELVPHERLTSHTGYVTAVGLRDEQWLAEWRANMKNLTPREAGLAIGGILHGALPQDDLNALFEHVRTTASATQMQSQATQAANFLLNFGRVESAERWREMVRGVDEIGYYGWRIYAPLVWPDADTLGLQEAMAKVQPLAAQEDTSSDALMTRCAREQWQARSGDVSTIRQTIRKIDAYLAANPDAKPWLGTCVYTLEIARAVGGKAPPAELRAAVQRADSALLHAPISSNWREYLAYITTQGYNQLGDYENALKVSRRAQEDAIWARSSLLLERARAAARTGRRDEAIASYRKFLKLYAHAEGNAQKTLTQVRKELEQLVGERS